MFSNELTGQVNQRYKKAYHELNKKVKETVTGKRYFVGSHDELGYYQPDLTDYLTDTHSRQGRFVDGISEHGSYFEYWYRDSTLIKIKFLCDENDYENDDYDVLTDRFNDSPIYLFYGIDLEGEVSLNDFYILKYGENGELLLSDKYIKQGVTDKYELYRAEYFYADGRLIKAVTCDGFREDTFEFGYSTAGELESAVLSDGRHRYDLDVAGKAARFRKFGLYHFG